MLAYALLTFGSLFAVIDPFAALPSFLAMTTGYTVEERHHTARVASLTCALVLIAFAVMGPTIFRLFGITLPAFQIAGGLILLLSALDMLRAKRSALQETDEETKAGLNKEDIAITPLAIPMLSGPGAITTAIVLGGHAQDWPRRLIFFGCIVLSAVLCYAILAAAASGVRRLNPIALNITTRLMGLLLAAIGVQFILSALNIH